MIYVWQKSYYYDTVVHVLLYHSENNIAYFFHSNKYNTSEMTYISTFSVSIFWYFVQICKIIFRLKTYFILKYLYKLDMVLKYLQSQQQWKKLRRCLIRLWFIRGVWMLNWGSKHFICDISTFNRYLEDSHFTIFNCRYFVSDSDDSDTEGGLGNVERVVMRPPGHSGKAKRGHLCFDSSFETGITK